MDDQPPFPLLVRLQDQPDWAYLDNTGQIDRARAVFADRGEVRHFCLPAYNYTRNPYACAFMRNYGCVFPRVCIAICVERRGFRTLVLFITSVPIQKERIMPKIVMAVKQY